MIRFMIELLREIAEGITRSGYDVSPVDEGTANE
jgi:hypothetical protein